MNKRITEHKRKRIPFSAIVVAIVLVIATMFLLIGMHSSAQSVPPSAAKLAFYGEYSVGGQAWRMIREGEHIPACSGDVTLRGYFELRNPETDAPMRHVPVESSMLLYLNHIAMTIYADNGRSFQFSNEHEAIGEDACAVVQSYFSLSTLGIEEGEDTVTIILSNPHRFGNENAIDEFLENMAIVTGANTETTMLERGSAERNIGLVVVISSLIILGIAVFSSIIHIKRSKEIWLMGLMSFFAGGYFLFDAFAVGFWFTPYIVNTRALGICMMLYMFFAIELIVTFLKGKMRSAAAICNAVSCVAIIVCIAVSLFTPVKFFDTWLYWALIECAVVAIVLICQAVSIPDAPLIQKLLLLVGIVTLLAFPIDVFATYMGFWEGGNISKHVFLVVFMMALVVVLRIIPNHVNAAIKAQQLEAEQQALKLELQESRISIMLSQMQPHFIFNTLNTIYHLCEIDPDVARKTISSFSEYLRNNIDNLGQSEMISFEKELSFVKTYLDIEKVRFDDELEITFDIEQTNFKLPVLTVQPIVENAVKHGTSKKEGVATLTLSTREYSDRYEIVIRDTGVGFDPGAHTNDGHRHVGISSVTERLKNLCGGTLTIESELGVGTTATIKIPKKEGGKA